jgi:hypothetical protein
VTVSTYESLRAQIEAHEAEEARLLAEVAAAHHPRRGRRERADDAVARASAAAHSLMLLAHAIERRAVATLIAIEASEPALCTGARRWTWRRRRTGRGRWSPGRSSELLAVADLLRARLRPGPEVATD